MLKIFVWIEGSRYHSLARRLKKNTDALVKLVHRLGNRDKIIRMAEQRKDANLGVFLVKDGTMRGLNKRHRKHDKATNVLSFVYADDFPHRKKEAKTLGEIYLAPDYARLHGQDLTVLLIHGFLHIFGYDHKTNRDMMKMRKAEKFLIETLTTNN